MSLATNIECARCNHVGSGTSRHFGLKFGRIGHRMCATRAVELSSYGIDVRTRAVRGDFLGSSGRREDGTIKFDDMLELYSNRYPYEFPFASVTLCNACAGDFDGMVTAFCQPKKDDK